MKEECKKRGWLLDNFPRTADQTVAMIDMRFIPHKVNIYQPSIVSYSDSYTSVCCRVSVCCASYRVNHPTNLYPCPRVCASLERTHVPFCVSVCVCVCVCVFSQAHASIRPYVLSLCMCLRISVCVVCFRFRCKCVHLFVSLAAGPEYSCF
jgi:hypothetical protein